MLIDKLDPSALLRVREGVSVDSFKLPGVLREGEGLLVQ